MRRLGRVLASGDGEWGQAPRKQVVDNSQAVPALTPQPVDAMTPVKTVRPVYPKGAELAGLQGRVTLSVTIAKDGSVSSVEPLAGDPQLAQAGVEAVRQWRYAPMEKPAETDVTLVFNLPRQGQLRDSVTPPMAIYKSEPEYNHRRGTTAATSRGIVELEITVNADGTVGEVSVTKSLDKALDDNAVQTVKTWRFLPALKDGNPVPYKTNVAVSFRLF